MPFHPDLIVTEPGSSQALIIVEVKNDATTPSVESHLKNYMWRMSCPVGLLASPRQISLYRNLFTGYSDDSVELVGIFTAPLDWSEFLELSSAIPFERHVQRWLEGLRDERPTDLLNEAADAIEQLVMPGLMHGDIHAAGPSLSR